jgi:DnaJ-class molecular chaperone
MMYNSYMKLTICPNCGGLGETKSGKSREFCDFCGGSGKIPDATTAKSYRKYEVEVEEED